MQLSASTPGSDIRREGLPPRRPTADAPAPRRRPAPLNGSGVPAVGLSGALAQAWAGLWLGLYINDVPHGIDALPERNEAAAPAGEGCAGPL